MKTTLTFNGPDDAYTLDNMLNANDMRSAIDDALEEIRKYLDYPPEELTDAEVEFLERLRYILADGKSRCREC